MFKGSFREVHLKGHLEGLSRDHSEKHLSPATFQSSEATILYFIYIIWQIVENSENLNHPVWINADIISGPGGGTPVDGTRYEHPF